MLYRNVGMRRKLRRRTGYGKKFHRSPVMDYMAVAILPAKDFIVDQPDNLELKKTFTAIDKKTPHAVRQGKSAKSTSDGQIQTLG